MLSAVPAAAADVFVLAGGGQITGELLNRDESPRRQYVVQTADGAKVTLDAAQVQKSFTRGPRKPSTSGFGPRTPTRPTAQWELAAWCREHRLMAQRERICGGSSSWTPTTPTPATPWATAKVNGQWVTRDEIMTQRGYVKYKGQWKTAAGDRVGRKQAEARSGTAGVVPEAQALAGLAAAATATSRPATISAASPIRWRSRR